MLRYPKLAFYFIFFIFSNLAQAKQESYRPITDGYFSSFVRNKIYKNFQDNLSKKSDSQWTPEEEYLNYLLEQDKYELGLRESAFQMLYKKDEGFEGSEIVNYETWLGMKAFLGTDESPKVHLFSKINRTQTILGEIYLAKMLFSVTHDVEELKFRQKIIQSLMEKPEVLGSLEAVLQQLKKEESRFFRFFDKSESLLYKDMFDSPYVHVLLQMFGDMDAVRQMERDSAFQSMKFFLYNFNLLASPNLLYKLLTESFGRALGGYTYLRGQTSLGLLSNFVQGTVTNGIPNLVSFLWNVNNISGTVWNSYQSFEELKHNVRHVQYSKAHLLSLRKYMDLIKLVERIFHALPDGLMDGKALFDFYKKGPILKLRRSLEDPVLESKNFFSNFSGNVYASLATMRDNKAAFSEVLQQLGRLDAFVSLARLMLDSKKQKNSWVFAQYLPFEGEPVVDAQGVWNPFLQSERAVPNNISMGGESARNILITGPNAGGKSTVMSSVLYNLILAQSLGISSAQSFKMTPMGKIRSYVNISDDLGSGESLYQAEMNRAMNILGEIQASNSASFVMMDEMFSGTNPQEGKIGSFFVAHELVKQKHNMLILSTHFFGLSKLEEQTKGLIKNYHVEANDGQNGEKIVYSYKLKPGATRQKVALRMMKNRLTDEQKQTLNTIENLFDEETDA